MARKTTTSTEVKRRYNEKAYTRVHLQVPKDLGDRFKEKCTAEGISQRQVLIEAIAKCLAE